MPNSMPHKVLFFSHEAELAGAEIALCRFVSALDRESFAPLVLMPRKGPLEELLTRYAIPYIHVPYFTTMVKELTDPVILKQIAVLRETINTAAPDIIVVNTSTIPHAIIAALTTDIPLVVHLHGFIDKRQFTQLPATTRQFEQMWLQFPETVLACSDWVAGHYTELLGREITVIPNFVTVPPDPGPPEQPLIVMLATLEANKRPDLFVEATYLIRKIYPNLKFRCALFGNGPTDFVDDLKKTITRRQLDSIFSLHPRTAEISSIYQRSAIVFIPSEVEPFSMVAIESGAYQRPVVSTRSGGPDTLIVDGETGFLIDVGDVNAAAERLAYLLQNPNVAHRMGNAARSRVMKYYSRETVMPLYEKLLEDTLLHACGGQLGHPMGQNPVRQPKGNCDATGSPTACRCPVPVVRE
jgi:glycosyltransferase involved in cell wall biosynthesis